MIQVIDKYLPEMALLSEVRKKLRECKDEWLEKDAKGNNVLGHNTVRQILESATDGITYWDFYIKEQWREEVYKFNKQTNSWVFDGYVYHVRGGIFIAGIGYREQYGSKVAIGGKDNQNSAYKAAASDCFKKSASLFGIGEAVYSKIKVQMDDDDQYNQMQQDPNYAFVQQPSFDPSANYYQQPMQQWQQGFNHQSFQDQSQSSWGYPRQ